MFQSLTQLDQQQQKIDVDKYNALKHGEKTGSDIELNSVKKELMKKGMPAAELGGDLAEILKKGKQYLRDSWQQNNPKPDGENFDNTQQYKKIINGSGLR